VLNGTRSFIPLVKRPATSTPYKGMMLTNPGGPGSAGVTFILHDPILANFALNYDLVSWDPRGVGLALPSGCVVNRLGGSKPSSVRKRDARLVKPDTPEGEYVDYYQTGTKMVSNVKTRQEARMELVGIPALHRLFKI